MTDRPTQPAGVNIGSASIVMIFAVLCLTVFAVLSFLTANSERALARKSAAAVTEFYAADLAATQRCNDFIARSRTADAAQSAAELALSVQDGAYTFAVPINDNSELSVSFTYDGTTLTILRWQAVNTGEYVIDSSIAVWPGN